MTQEEKAKAYDEAIERARKINSGEGIEASSNWTICEVIFPELKDSKDEMIRKNIIIALKSQKDELGDFYKSHNTSESELVSWLEKQGEKKETACDRCRKAQPNGSCQDITALGRCYIEGERKVKDTTVIYHESGLKALEKSLEKGCTEGEQKSADNIIPFFKTGNVIKNKKNGDTVKIEEIDEKHQRYCYKGWDGVATIHSDFSISEQDDWELVEQNPADKVKPKFHEGDWIVDNCSNVWKIEGIINQFYILEGIDGAESRPTIEWVNKTFHLWSIKDAKDGDVLVDVYGNIGIFEKRYGINWHTYCYLGNEGRLVLEGGSHGSICYPATKKQRDQLEKAMADARYAFDFEKKELKKIHIIDEGKDEMDYCFTKMMNGEKVEPQSPTTTSCSKELEAKMYEACDRFFAPNTDPNKYSAADLFYAGVEAGCDLNMLSWSEEDEKMLVDCFNILHRSDYPTDKVTKTVDWLKSIKDRYTWKPSDEQIELLEALVEDNNQRYFYTTLNSLYEQLKKLKKE